MCRICELRDQGLDRVRAEQVFGRELSEQLQSLPDGGFIQTHTRGEYLIAHSIGMSYRERGVPELVVLLDGVPEYQDPSRAISEISYLLQVALGAVKKMGVSRENYPGEPIPVQYGSVIPPYIAPVAAEYLDDFRSIVCPLATAAMTELGIQPDFWQLMFTRSDGRIGIESTDNRVSQPRLDDPSVLRAVIDRHTALDALVDVEQATRH